jgi:mitogen-activated protein kinase kinase kinase
MLPPPPGPPPGSALAQQAPWHNGWGQRYDARYMPPPPPGGQHQAYNPKFHTMAGVGALGIPPPPPTFHEQMSATYIPGADTYGEGVGIPGLGGIDETATYSATSQSSWMTGSQSTVDTSITTPIDSAREGRPYPHDLNARDLSTTSNATASSGIPPELAAQWPLERVLLWLQGNQFSKDWQETFKRLGLQGTQFLELGSGHGGRGNFGMMHQQVYPMLAQVCSNSGTGWDQAGEREEGKRMRRLIRGVVTGRPVELAKATANHARKESASAQTSLPSAGTDGESPNVSNIPWNHDLSF